MSEVFYAVVGQNGVMVTDNPKKAESIQKYIHRAKVGEFDCFSDAQRWALKLFNSQLEPWYYPLYYLLINHAIFKQDLTKPIK